MPGERQTALHEQADELIGRACVGRQGHQQERGQQAKRALQRRNSIWIGPSRRP
jgi:hypothetical protein